MREDLKKMMDKNRELIKDIYDGNMKNLMDKYEKVNGEYCDLQNRYTQLELKWVHEYNGLQGKYEGVLGEMETKRINVREMEVIHNEMKFKIEEMKRNEVKLKTINDGLEAQLVEMEATMEIERKRIMDGEKIEDGFGSIYDVINSGFHQVGG